MKGNAVFLDFLQIICPVNSVTQACKLLNGFLMKKEVCHVCPSAVDVIFIFVFISTCIHLDQLLSGLCSLLFLHFSLLAIVDRLILREGEELFQHVHSFVHEVIHLRTSLIECDGLVLNSDISTDTNLRFVA